MKDRHKLRPFWQRFDWSSIDPDAYLDERDLPHIEVLWQQAHDVIAAEKAKTSARDVEGVSQHTTEKREEVFKHVLHVTGHSELAQCISDDYDLIGEAFWYQITESLYINALADAYAAGRLPTREDFA